MPPGFDASLPVLLLACQAHKASISSDPEDPVRLVGNLQLPVKAKVAAVQWLPFKDAAAGGHVMNKLMIAGDVKGMLHVVDTSGSTLKSLPSGHSGAVTAISVTKQHEHECTVVTGGAQGDVRIHTISRPPRYNLKPPLDQKGGARKSVEWTPLVRLIAHFAPSTAEPLLGLGPDHFGADLAGGKAIAEVVLVPRGRRSYNLLVSDAAGRLSVHMQNGSLIASHEVEGSVEAHAETKSWAALSVDKRLVLFEPRSRRLHPVCPCPNPRPDRCLARAQDKACCRSWACAPSRHMRPGRRECAAPRAGCAGRG